VGRRIKTMKQIFLLLCTIALVPALPLRAQLSTDSLQTLTEKKESLQTFEHSFTPSSYDNDIYLFKRNDTAKLYGTSIDLQSTAVPETLQGYRVQLLSTNSYDDALSFKNTLSAAYPDLWIYSVYETPAYKIRAGDFLNRYEAKTLLDTLQQNGYKNAWIVPDKIIHNQPPKPPLPTPIDSTSFGSTPDEQ
jgi:hypothetical protein